MEWKEVRLESILALPSRNGLTKPSKIRGKGVKMIGMGELFANPIIYDIPMDRVPVTDKELFNSRIMPGDLLFARQSLTLEGAGKCCYVKEVKEETVFESHLIRIRIDKTKADAEFIYYFFNSFIGKCLIQNLVTQVAAAGIRGSELVKLEITIPKELEDQRRIASILSSLDRKIELNNKINADLEEMAQAIFKNWFVDFEPFKDGKFVDSELGMIPEGWKVGKITDIGCLITDYVSNGSFASLKQNVHLYETKEYAQFIRNTDLKTKTFSVYVDKHSYDFLSKSTLYGNEIIISNVGDVGSVHLCPKLDIPMTLGNNIIMLRPNEKEYNYFLYLWFKYFSGQGLIQGIKGGSAQPKFNKTDFKNLPLLIPSFEIIERSYWIFESMFSILSSNVKENSRLSLLRDTLLPRLMSGEIEVPQ